MHICATIICTRQVQNINCMIIYRRFIPRQYKLVILTAKKEEKRKNVIENYTGFISLKIHVVISTFISFDVLNFCFFIHHWFWVFRIVLILTTNYKNIIHNNEKMCEDSSTTIKF